MNDVIVFEPRRSMGWIWPLLIALFLLATTSMTLFAVPPGEEGRVGVLITAAIGLAIGIPFLALAALFPTMRYELGRSELTLRYGPVLRYTIPLDEIDTVRSRNLQLSLWSSLRFPGLALFGVNYGDVGTVKMCATGALNRILLIEAGKDKYGITPADEEAFVAALRDRMEK